MKKRSIVIFSLLTASFFSHAQQNTAGHAAIQREGRMPQFADWDPTPKMHAVPPEYYNEHAIILLESDKLDYKYEGSGITKYNTIHRIIKVLDRYGIESFNTIQVPYRDGESRVDSIKARTILPDGTVHDVKYEMLYVGGGSFLFNLDGMEKNAEVEIVIKYKEMSSYFGSVRYQYKIPVLNAYFEMNYPKEMTFNTKGYHGFPSGVETVVGGHKQVKIFEENIPALQSQPMSYYDLYAMRIEYGLDHVTSRGGYEKGEDYTVDFFAHHLYKEYYNLKDADKKAAARFLNTIGIRGGETESEKIKKIEDGIKTNIVFYWELSGKDAENLDTIISKKSASQEGIIKLFSACLKTAGVKHEIGATSDRTEHLMDPKFTNWEPLDKILFYFPNTGNYLDPTEKFYRYPEIPSNLINNKGVFCKTNPETGFTIGREETEAEATVRMINALPASYTTVGTTAVVNIDKDFNTVVDLKRTYTGYSAPELRKELATATPDDKKKIAIKQSILADKPEMLVKYSIANESVNSVYDQKPLQINATVNTSDLVEKAGADYLVKVGEILGNQTNFYSRDERILPIDIDYPYTRTCSITMNIPEGYKVANLAELRKEEEHNDKNNGNTTAYFKSNYELKGNKLTITATKSFTQLHYTVSEFDAFKKVVNAAADFGKASILLEPEKTKAVKKAKSHTMAAKKDAPKKSGKETTGKM